MITLQMHRTQTHFTTTNHDKTTVQSDSIIPIQIYVIWHSSQYNINEMLTK